MLQIVVWDINPEPWRTPGISRQAVKDGKLAAYQQALKDELEDHWEPEEGEWYVEFYFWRSSAHGQPADVTNLQKATEDACQGILYFNDKTNRHVESMICEQTPETRPCILIRISEFDPSSIPWPGEPPDTPTRFEGSDWTPPDEDIF